MATLPPEKERERETRWPRILANPPENPIERPSHSFFGVTGRTPATFTPRRVSLSIGLDLSLQESVPGLSEHPQASQSIPEHPRASQSIPEYPEWGERGIQSCLTADLLKLKIESSVSISDSIWFRASPSISEQFRVSLSIPMDPK